MEVLILSIAAFGIIAVAVTSLYLMTKNHKPHSH